MANIVLVFGSLSVILFIDLTNAAIEGLQLNVLGDDALYIKKDNSSYKESDRSGRSLHKECSGGSLSAKCLKIHALSFIEDLGSRDELSLLPGLSIVKENLSSISPSPEEMAAELSRQFPGKPEEKLNRFLIYRLQDYLDNHSLKYKLLDPQTSKEAMEMAKGDKEAIGRKHGGGGGGIGGKGGGALLAAAMMMKGNMYFL